jgi:DNA repair exonuclease SbcCD ATPase subunit
MITITKVKIKGFRGFTYEKEFDFNFPVTILFGENGKGKSSLLNAIEWGLFGNDCIGKNTGIRERIDWEIKNRNTDECYVQVIMIENEKEYTVKRIWKSKTKNELTIKVSNGNLREGEEAEKELVGLTKNFSFKDFLTSIYQHQEVIRFFLIQEPKDRDEAIDRLLGLSEYRNVIDGINNAKIKGETLQKEIENISKQIKAKIQVWEEQIREKKKEPKSNLKVNTLYTADKYKELAKKINENFKELVKKDYKGILAEGEEYLKKKLKGLNIKYAGN